MRDLQPQGPYYLAGYSFGGVLAFEMAAQLEAQGQSVGLVALLDAFLPQTRSERLVHPWQIFLDQLKSGVCWSELAPRFRTASGLLTSVRGWRTLASRIRARIERTYRQSVPRSDEEHIMTWELPAARRNVALKHLQACNAYRPKVYNGTLTLFVSQDQSEHRWLVFRDRHLGWSRWTRAPIDACIIPGTHSTVLSSENVPELARLLSSRIEAFHTPELCFA
jgi:thioesterase domain-containing protein